MKLNFAVIDIVFILIIIALMIRAIRRGFVTELSSMAAPVLGLFAAVFFSKALSSTVALITGSENSIWNQLIAFFSIFLIIYLIVFILQGFLQGAVEKLDLQRADSVLGGFWGLAEGILLVLILLFIMNWLPFTVVHDALKNSFFANIFLPLLPTSNDLLDFVQPSEACLKI